MKAPTVSHGPHHRKNVTNAIAGSGKRSIEFGGAQNVT
jgi:hypothetical protein